jgi:hypothetical protein
MENKMNHMLYFSKVVIFDKPTLESSTFYL